MGDILLRRIGEIIDPVYDCKSSCHRYAHGIYNSLYSQLSQLNGSLLHGGSPSIGNRALQQLPVKHQPFFPQPQHWYLLLYINHTKQAAKSLADYSGNGAAVASGP